MQRGRFLNLTALAGALALAAGMASAAPPPAATPPAATPPAATPPAASTLPSGFTAMDIGKTTKGDTSFSNGVWTLTSQGGDIQNKADVFRYVYSNLPGNGGVTARLLSQTGGAKGGWSKSGVMIRQSLDPGSVDYTLNFSFTGAKQAAPMIEAQHRDKANNNPSTFGLPAPDPSKSPIWLRAQRIGADYQLLRSDNGKDWQKIDDRTMPIDASAPVSAGIGQSSGNATDPPAVGMFDNVSVSSDIIQPDIVVPGQVVAVGGNGAVLLTYSTTTGASYNIYRQQVGSKTAAALVNQAPTANGWFIDTTVANGTAYLYTVTSVIKSQADPTKLLESPASAQALAQPTLPVAGLNVEYGGVITPATVAVDNNGVMTLTASGSPIWDTSANGTFLAAPVSGDYSMNVKVLAAPARQAGLKQNSDTKVGPMIRASMGVVPGDDYGWLFTADRTDGNGVIFEGRPSGAKSGAYSETATKEKDVKYPLWLRLNKKGAVLSAFQSNDGSTFTQAGTNHDYGLLPAITYAGIGATSGDSVKTATFMLDANSIQLGPAQ